MFCVFDISCIDNSNRIQEKYKLGFSSELFLPQTSKSCSFIFSETNSRKVEISLNTNKSFGGVKPEILFLKVKR